MEMRFVRQDGRGETDAVLAAAVALIRAHGLAVVGAVQTNARRAGRDKCDMDVHVLPDGPVLCISQDLGASSRGCRLDPSALETAVAETQARLAGAELLAVNKFGKQEAKGRGFVPVIAEALAMGLPALVGVNQLNLQDFEAFAEGFARPLPGDPEAIAAWARVAVRRDAA